VREAKIRRSIRDFLRMMGGAVWDLEQNRPTRQTPGFPDLVVLGWGHVAFVEVKTPQGRLTEHQELFRRECEANGGEHHVWRSVTDAVEWHESVSEEAA
jgi:hypothetical protein